MKNLLALAAITFAGFAGVASAQSPAWVAGKHYTVIPTQRTNVPAGKVEVLEVFSYGCSACNLFRPLMKNLKSSLPANVQFVYLPASWNKVEEAWPMFQRAYITAQTLGVADQANDAMYDAVWTTGELAVIDPSTRRPRARRPTIDDAARFYQRVAGVKAADFLAASKSFSVDLKLRQADGKILAMQVSGTPTLVVNGKYRVNNEYMESNEQIIELVKFLVAKESAPAAAPARKS